MNNEVLLMVAKSGVFAVLFVIVVLSCFVFDRTVTLKLIWKCMDSEK